MKIFEVMWLVAAFISLYMAISRGMKGESYGSYIYITVFTAGVAGFMYWFKKRNRQYLKDYYAKKEQESAKKGTEQPKVSKEDEKG